MLTELRVHISNRVKNRAFHFTVMYPDAYRQCPLKVAQSLFVPAEHTFHGAHASKVYALRAFVIKVLMDRQGLPVEARGFLILPQSEECRIHVGKNIRLTVTVL
jgi:hypothetical protein